MNKIEIELKRPFDPKQISWRVGATSKKKDKAIALAYIDARDVIKRLDDVIGPFNWQNRYTHVADGLVICEIGINYQATNQWIWKANGAGSTNVEAEKGKLSDAFKRAAVQWGIGKYLYQLPNKWVPIDEYKKIIKPPALPNWATPEGYDIIMTERAAKEYDKSMKEKEANNANSAP